MEPVTTAVATSPWWGPPLVAGGLSAAGGLITSALGAWQAEKNRDFQRDMSNTAHQREIADLKNAGLNPILSSKLGGSSTPGGATGQVGDFSQMATSALQAMNMASNLRLQDAQTRDINAAAQMKEVQGRVLSRTEIEQIDTVRESLRKLQLDADISWDMRDKIQREIRNLDQTLKLLKLNESHSAFDLARARQESDFYSSFGGKVAPWLDHILGKLKIPMPGRVDFGPRNIFLPQRR